MRFLLAIVVPMILLSFAIGANPPMADKIDDEQNNSHNHSNHSHNHTHSFDSSEGDVRSLKYDQYNAVDWRFTGKQDVENKSNTKYILDSGSTADGNIQFRVSANNSNLTLNSIEINEDRNIKIMADELSNNTSDYEDIYLDIQNYNRTQVNNLSASIETNSGIVKLSREVCGCAMLVDPRITKNNK